MSLKISPAKGVSGSIRPPGDKSITHRAFLFGAMASGKTIVKRFLQSEDCFSTVSCLRALGATIAFSEDNGEAAVEGVGDRGFQEPAAPLNAGNSGTTARLLSGLLAGQPFFSALHGDESLGRRPMGRIVEPLAKMGAEIMGREGATKLPLAIRGGRLKGICHHSPVASAQVKSALLIAGLYAEGETSVIEPSLSRNHSELMLRSFGADIVSDGLKATARPLGRPMRAIEITVPGDPSSAAFFAAAAAIIPGGSLEIKGASLNPTRTGFFDALERMGAKVERRMDDDSPEDPIGDIVVSHAPLKGIEIGGEEIPRLIDELPLLAMLGALAEGTTRIFDAGELRAKESDRIQTTAATLRAFGAKVEETADGLILAGPAKFKGARVDSFGDHRIAMMAAIAGLAADGNTAIENEACMAISFPDFADRLKDICKF